MPDLHFLPALCPVLSSASLTTDHWNSVRLVLSRFKTETSTLHHRPGIIDFDQIVHRVWQLPNYDPIRLLFRHHKQVSPQHARTNEELISDMEHLDHLPSICLVLRTKDQSPRNANT